MSFILQSLQSRNFLTPIPPGFRLRLSEPKESQVSAWYLQTMGVREGSSNTTELAASLNEFGVESGADDFIIDTVRSQPNEIVLVCLGALTNLAMAIDQCPSICQDLKDVCSWAVA
jgi:inosine-uridine nucleoside N-ribohydrolase